MPKLVVPKSYVDEELEKLGSALRAELAEVKSQVQNLQLQISNGVRDGKNQAGGPLVSVSFDELTNSKNGAAIEHEADVSMQVHVVKSGTKEAESSSKADLQQELICFDRKSAWSIPLVISWNNFSESCFACALLIVNVAMQSLFTLIIASKEFLGTDFSENLQDALVWRRSSAHDVQYVDLAGKSLATRVCDEDGSLIYSTKQAVLVSEINSYLGLGKLGPEGFAVTSFQPGVLLAVLCILLWIICIVRELRNVWYVLQAVLFGHMQTATEGRQGVQAVSGRRAAAMTFVCIGRATVACALMVSGTLWLSRTTSITELMLNSVALEAVLHVDEFIFTAFVPTELQQQIQKLRPVMMRKSRRWPRLENFVLACTLMAGLLLPYLLLLSPLTKDMLAVKNQLCGGNLLFAVGQNNLVVAHSPTASASGEDSLVNNGQALVQAAAMKYAFPAESDNLAAALQFPHLSVLQGWMPQRYDEWVYTFDRCVRHGVDSDFSIFLAAAAFEAGFPAAQRCQELKPLCSENISLLAFTSSAARWLRVACPDECGCTDPLSTPLLKAPAHGCRGACIQEAYGFSYSVVSPLYGNVPNFTLGCKDAVPGPGWRHFWDNYLDYVSAEVGFNYSTVQSLVDWVALARNAGCMALQFSPLDLAGNQWCRGSHRYRPLAWFCPETCGCATSGNSERDHFCYAYDYCPVNVMPNETDAFWSVARKHDLLKPLLNPELLSVGNA